MIQFCSCRFFRCSSLLVERFMYINVHKFREISVKKIIMNRYQVSFGNHLYKIKNKIEGLKYSGIFRSFRTRNIVVFLMTQKDEFYFLFALSAFITNIH